MSKYYGYSHKSTQFNNWIQYFCRHGSLLVTDLDFIFYDDNLKRMKLIEVKGFNNQLKEWQTNIFNKIDSALKNQDEFEYEGFFVISMDTDNPETAKKITINGLEVTRQQLIDFLDFKIRFYELADD